MSARNAGVYDANVCVPIAGDARAFYLRFRMVHR